jgi:5-amino-6-(5-phosphoribosylamino)uracil reductase
MPNPNLRPHTTVVLAMSLDGKIAGADRSPARFGSKADKHHLELQIAQADAVLFGAATLRAYGTTLPIRQPRLLQQRQRQAKPPQPTQIVCSGSGNLDRQWPFFQQPVPRWLLTTQSGAQNWQPGAEFERVIVANSTIANSTVANSGTGSSDRVHWQTALLMLRELEVQRLTVLGGGEIVGALVAAQAIDELWITVCPLLLGGKTAPTLLEGIQFVEAIAPRLQLIELNGVDDEVFLHYRVL